ncbi:MAG: hypothetical protein ACRDHW_11515, partial [Ktedonobacteraceae bacterium]
MTTSSFANTSSLSWQPASAYQTILSTIQNEVNQGLWTNQEHIDDWCCILVSPPQGMNNSWVIHTYQLTKNSSQQTTVIWPAGWPAPSENINGQLPSHFFSSGSAATPKAVTINPE